MVLHISPVNWYPDYGSKTLTVGNDTTGFVLSKTDTALVYRHKPGVTYPVTCKLAPYTNLEWKDYVFSGKITKPVGSMYDSVPIGLVVYRQGDGSGYKVTFKSDGVYLDGGKYDMIKISDTAFTGGKTLGFRVSVVNSLKDSVPDGSVRLEIYANINNGNYAQLFKDDDETQDRLKYGESGVSLDMSAIQSEPEVQAIMFKNIFISKVQ